MKKILSGGVAALAVATGVAIAAPAHAEIYSFVSCPTTFPNALYPHSGIATGVTSCPFAESVRAAYINQSSPGYAATIEAHSPVTGQDYIMDCVPGVATVDGVMHSSVSCSGGSSASVVLF